MGYYIIKRLISIVPFAFFAVLIVFLIFESSWQPDLTTLRNNTYGYSTDHETLERIKCEQRAQLHLDWPLFYFSISSAALPKHFGSICSEQERHLIKRMCLHNGNTNGALAFIDELKAKLDEGFDSKLEKTYTVKSISEIPNLVAINSDLLRLFNSYMQGEKLVRVFIPRVQFHSKKNRFHEWVINVLQLDFGKSRLDNQLVTLKINSALLNTLSFTIPAVLLIFIISTLTGYLLSKGDSTRNQLISNILYFIDAIPMVWLSIIILLAAAALGAGYSTLDFGTNSLWAKVTRYSLPMLTLVLAAIPYVTKQVQQAIMETKNEPFILSAQAKGLTAGQVFFKHVLPNASLPIVTLFFSYLAMAFGGAFVVEWVFSINGVGKLMADAVLANDLPIISAIILYFIFIKMILTLLSDVTNYLINPSIKF